MTSRFMIPAAVAAALHAILIFGFPTGYAPPADIDLHRRDDRTPPPPDTVVVEWAAAPDDPADVVPNGATPDSPPVTIEPPHPETTNDVFMSPSIPHPTPGPVTNMTRIEPFGDPSSSVDIGPGVTGPMSSAMLDNPPRTRSQIAPIYPYEARVSGRPGEVLVEFVVDETGHVLDPHVVRSSDALFETPTLRAIARWRFEPGRRSGRSVRFRMAVPVAFAVNP